MEEGAIVRIALPQSDGKIKSRPALLLKRIEPFNDWLLCSISSKLHNEVKGVDIVIDKEHPDYVASRLKYPGVVRVAHLFTLPEKMIEGTIGNISPQTHKKLLNNLTAYLSK